MRLLEPRLAVLVQRLEAARPRQAWGVRRIDWQAWEAAAREAAGLPGAEWAAWRGTVGAEEAVWPPRHAALSPAAEAHR